MAAMLPWLWLNEAALLVAERLMNEHPQDNIAPASTLNRARVELLDWAYRGVLEVQGKQWSLPGPEERDYPDDQDWNVINASMWDPYRLLKPMERRELRASPSTANPDDTAQVVSMEKIFASLTAPSSGDSEGSQPENTYVVVDWGRNVLTIDGPEIFEPHGYSELRVRRAVIDEILSPAQTLSGRTDAPAASKEFINSPRPNNTGGAPRKFADDLLIEIVRIANDIDGLPEDKQDLVRQLRKYNEPSWGDNLPSESTIQRIVDMVYKRVRPPKT